MANYHFEVKCISRGKGDSITRRVSYICGKTLRDSCLDINCYKNRNDVLYCNVFLPDGALPNFRDLQTLCNEIEKAEKRYDSQTGKEIIASLPNELPHDEIINITKEFIETNFVEKGLAVIAAIHEGKNLKDESKNNPHVHILVTTRTLDPSGFNRLKARELLDRKEALLNWREQWARVQNLAYERNGFDIRVSHESLEVQGVERIPIPHLPLIDWQREQKGRHTPSGDKRREILEKNKQKEALEKIREREMLQTRSRRR